MRPFSEFGETAFERFCAAPSDSPATEAAVAFRTGAAAATESGLTAEAAMFSSQAFDAAEFAGSASVLIVAFFAALLGVPGSEPVVSVELGEESVVEAELASVVA